MPLIGYTDEWSYLPGDSVSVKLHDDSAPRTVDMQLVRMVGASDDQRQGLWTPVPGVPTCSFTTRRQRNNPGSSATTDLNLGGVFGLAILVQPTLLTGLEQIIVGAGDITLALDAEGRPVLRAGNCQVTHPEPLQPGIWHWIVAGHDGTTATIACDAPEQTRQVAPAGEGGRFTLAGNFNGRIEHPVVLHKPPTPQLLSVWCLGDPHPSLLAGDRLAEWDFSQDIPSFEVADISGNGHTLVLRGLPQRAVTGVRWTPGTADWTTNPQMYGAIHFNQDAVEDAGWAASASLVLTEDLRSGFYALKIEEEFLPIFVRPSRPRARLLLVASTATYLAYSNSRCWWERSGHEVQCDAAITLCKEEQIVLERPELGLSAYDQYADGSPVSLVSMRRPNLDLRPGHGRREGYTSDLSLVGWLERRGVDYDVITDHDLSTYDKQGDYQVVMLATHPEYYSSGMWHALHSHLERGGRLMVMGGNAFCWKVAFHPDRPWIMEVRKPQVSYASERFRAAETHLAFTGEIGGYHDKTDLPADPLLGVGTASMGFDERRPFVRVTRDPQFDFIFDGTDGNLENVVFQEWDNSRNHNSVVLARSDGHSLTSRRFGATRKPNHAEMTFTQTSGGGAVLSFASMGWCLALSDPKVDRVTANVLSRFLDSRAFEL